MSRRTIRILQILSLAYIWVFVLGLTVWIVSLLQVSSNLDDALNASVAIGIIAIPLFVMIASILTYVFVSLQKHRHTGSPDGREMET